MNTKSGKHGTENGFKTPDSYLTSFLITRGFTPELVCNSSGRVLFAFPASRELEDAVDEYPIAMVSASQFSAVMRGLKSRLYSMKKEKENNGEK